jgi:hypothetical protein
MLDTKIARVKELIAKKEVIDAELEELLQGSVKKSVMCSHCRESGHTARSCPQRRETAEQD